MAEIEPRLFELTAQAQVIEGVLTQALEAIKNEILDRKIGEIYNPAEFKKALVDISGHPLATAIREAKEQRTSIAVSVAQEIRDGHVLYRIEEELRQNRSAVESVEGAVKEGILPEDILTLPNVDHFRTRAQDYQLILELYEMGVGLLPPPAEKPVVSKEMAAIEAERKRLLRIIHIQNKATGDMTIYDQPIHLRSSANRQLFYRLRRDLTKPWDDSLGVHSREVENIAKENGYTGKSPSSMPIRRLNELFTEHGLPIHIAALKDPEGGRARYYRIREGTMPKMR